MRRRFKIDFAKSLITILVLGLSNPLAAGLGNVNAEEVSSSEDGYSWVNTGLLTDGDFEQSLDDWEIVLDDTAEDAGTTIKVDKWASNNTSSIFNIWNNDADSRSVSLTKTITLPKGNYKLGFIQEGAEGVSGLSVLLGDKEVTCPATNGWDIWSDEIFTPVLTVEDEIEVKLGISGEITPGYWGDFDDIILYSYEEVEKEVRAFDYDTTPVSIEPVESDLVAEKVDGLANGFITGFDLSSYLSIRKSGATYKDFDGNELTDSEFFNLLKDNGVNYVRLRVWVDPTDGAGNYYGGGNCDVKTAAEIGKYATDAGMRVLVDFHYSDFWTDPGKQTAPKLWKELKLEEKAETLKKWTETSLQELIDSGVDVGMVQIGNETTTGFCGEKTRVNMCTLFKAGSEGVQAIEKANDKKIMIAIHLTNPDSIDYVGYAKDLDTNGVIYDVFATSYYPYWHGTLDNLKTKLSAVAEKYNKYVMVAETSYVRTIEDGDGWENTESEKKLTTDDFPYEISEQGQVNHFRNVISTISSIDNNKGIGVFWWEPAWIPVNNYAGTTDKEAVLENNKAIWEKYGSGWATSAAADYDKNVGEWYGGSAVDNESVFDFDGKALESLKLFNLIRGGSTATNGLSKIYDASAAFEEGEDIILPEKVGVLYKDGTKDEAKVKWDKEDISLVEKSGVGNYTVKGIATYNDLEFDVICKVEITIQNLIREKNYGFEDGDKEWKFTGSADKNRITNEESNQRTGSYNYHFYDGSDFTCGIEQSIKLSRGIYKYGGYIQGGDCGDTADIYIYAKTKDNEYKKSAVLTGWNEWKNPEITDIVISEDDTELSIGLNITAAGGGWGSADDFYLYRVGDAPEVTPTTTPTPSSAPTSAPTSSLTPTPAVSPTITPVTDPTITPTAKPTVKPSEDPTVTPTAAPTETKEKNQPAEKGTVIKYKNSGNSYVVTSSDVKNPTVSYKKPKNKKVTKVIVPKNIVYGGITYKVAAIDSNAFSGCKKLKKVTVGSNVTSIKKNAFKGCTKLKTINIKSKVLKSVGRNAIKGINKKAVIKVPSSKLKAYKKLFKTGKGLKKTMKFKKNS